MLSFIHALPAELALQSACGLAVAGGRALVLTWCVHAVQLRRRLRDADGAAARRVHGSGGGCRGRWRRRWHVRLLADTSAVRTHWSVNRQLASAQCSYALVMHQRYLWVSQLQCQSYITMSRALACVQQLHFGGADFSESEWFCHRQHGVRSVQKICFRRYRISDQHILSASWFRDLFLFYRTRYHNPAACVSGMLMVHTVDWCSRCEGRGDCQGACVQACLKLTSTVSRLQDTALPKTTAAQIVRAAKWPHLLPSLLHQPPYLSQ